MYYTGRRYYSGIIGCISEIVLGGELKLSLDPETLGLAHNVEPGYFWDNTDNSNVNKQTNKSNKTIKLNVVSKVTFTIRNKNPTKIHNR